MHQVGPSGPVSKERRQAPAHAGQRLDAPGPRGSGHEIRNVDLQKSRDPNERLQRQVRFPGFYPRQMAGVEIAAHCELRYGQPRALPVRPDPLEQSPRHQRVVRRIFELIRRRPPADVGPTRSRVGVGVDADRHRPVARVAHDHPRLGGTIAGRPGVMRRLRIDADDRADLHRRVHQDAGGRSAAAAPEEVVRHLAVERREELLATVKHEVVLGARLEPHLQDRIRSFPERGRVEVLVADAVLLFHVGPPGEPADFDDGMEAWRRNNGAQRALGRLGAVLEVHVGEPAERPRLRRPRLGGPSCRRLSRARATGRPQGAGAALGRTAFHGHGSALYAGPNGARKKAGARDAARHAQPGA